MRHHYDIIRDVDGIPHVRASTVLDAMAGQGHAAAEDRLWQMCLDRWKALGQLASVVGPAAVPSDELHRRLGLADAARRNLDSLGSETQTILEAYAAGVNRHLADGSPVPHELELLGVGPEPWEPWHCIVVHEVRHFAMGTYEAKLWRSGLVRRLGAARAARLWPTIDERTIDPDGEAVRVAAAVEDAMATCTVALDAVGSTDELGSNNLVIAGTRTSSGRPIVAGDPHRAIDLPNVYWQNHITCTDPDDPLDAIGLSFPGVPGFPHFGHNADVAWCITHGMADDQDLYVERFRPVDGDGDEAVEVATADGWEPVEEHEEMIEVAGGDPVSVRCLRTSNGPVVAGDDHVGIALRWTALDGPDTTADALLPMMRARSVDDLDVAFRAWVVPVNNVLMADTGGTIAYRMRGRLAIRGEENGWTAVPGDEPERRWAGFVDDADLPRWRDPGAGYLVTANNRITAGGPYVGHDWAHPSRATTISDRLGAADDWDVTTVTSLLGDTHSPVAGAFARRLLALDDLHPTEERARRVLRDWDQRMDADSAAAALYGHVRAELVRIVSHDIGLVDDQLPGVAGPSLHQRLRFVNARLATWIDDRDLVSDRALQAALRFAVRSLELSQGTDPAGWCWGVSHTALFVHPLAAWRPDLADQLSVPPAVGLGGDNECVWATSTAPPSTRASNGPVARYVFDVGDWDRSSWIVPHGVSGDPRSPHHLDQLERWTTVQMLPMRFSRDAVDAATSSTTSFSTK
ncbi:MAG: penicillin acylase family protein [Acidimicrobiales bacterium]